MKTIAPWITERLNEAYFSLKVTYNKAYFKSEQQRPALRRLHRDFATWLHNIYFFNTNDNAQEVSHSRS